MNQKKRLLLFVLLVALVIDASTDTPYVPGKWLGPFYGYSPATQLTSALCAAILCALALLPLLPSKTSAVNVSSSGTAAAIAIRLLPLPSMIFAFLWSRPHVGHSFALPWNIFVFATPALLLFSAVRRWPASRIVGIAALAGVVVRLVHFHRFSIDVGADMLPLTRSALAAFLTGHSPYGYHHVPDAVPLTYYPLTWLAYLGPYLAHIDLRWTNLAAELSIPGALIFAARGRDDVGGAASSDGLGSALLAWSFLFLLPSSVFFDRITTAPVAWALLAWTLAVVARGSRWDWAWAGLLAATTPLAALTIPFLILLWLRQISPRQALMRTALAAAVALAIILPFYLWSPRGFIDGAVLWFNDLTRFPGTKWRTFRTWQRYVGFGGLFWRAGLQSWLTAMQWTLVAGLSVWFLLKGATRSLLPAALTSAFIAFMVFNTVHWPYFYQPALFCGLLALALPKTTGYQVTAATVQLSPLPMPPRTT